MSDHDVKSLLSCTSFSVCWKVFLLEEEPGSKFVTGVYFLVILGLGVKKKKTENWEGLQRSYSFLLKFTPVNVA